VHSRMLRAAGAVGAVGASLALAGPALAASAPTLYVNPAGQNTNTNGTDNTCRLQSNPCQTIQHAIDEAPATAKISVAAGTYAEQLTITGKNLTITGAGTASTFIKPDAPLNTKLDDPTHQNTPQADIVTFDGTKSGGLAQLTVDGSTATVTDGSTNYVGVFMLDASGTLNTVDIDHVHHDEGSFGDQPGANGGVLVANDDENSHTVTMNTVEVSDYDKNGITCRSLGTICNITNSTVTGSGAISDNAQNGIELYGIAAASVTGTTVTENTYENAPGTSPTNASGFLVINVGKLTLSKDTAESNDVNIDAIDDMSQYARGPEEGVWSITNNTVSDATNFDGAAPLGAGIGDGIDLTGTSGVTVDSNKVTDNQDWGISLLGASASKVGADGKANTVTGNTDDGIYLGEYVTNDATVPSTNNTVTYNRSSSNGDDGILVAGADSSNNQQATGNRFGHNILQNNLHFDAEDFSSGSGTAGTANTWTGNKCQPSHDANPASICS